MKNRFVSLLCCSIVLATALIYAQDAGYQTARVVSIERVAADARHPENADNYKIAMRIGDAIYKCTANQPASVFLNWTNNKEYPARVNPGEKTMTVKNTDGQVL